jgi:hypothetical protein
VTIYSSPNQLTNIQQLLTAYLRLPFASENIPGSIMQRVLAQVREGDGLATYDFVDVVNEDIRRAWQVKSTKASTPVTWKRAKIPDSSRLIQESLKSDAAVQALGNTIINFCNAHVAESFERYEIDEIGYARLVVHPGGIVTYFEKALCTRQSPLIFNSKDFVWKWSTQKSVGKKEQLSALHGFRKVTGERWWAWHGRGENQLHFTGERAWWPTAGSPHEIRFSFPTDSEKISLESLLEWLSAAPLT